MLLNSMTVYQYIIWCYVMCVCTDYYIRITCKSNMDVHLTQKILQSQLIHWILQQKARTFLTCLHDFQKATISTPGANVGHAPMLRFHWPGKLSSASVWINGFPSMTWQIHHGHWHTTRWCSAWCCCWHSALDWMLHFVGFFSIEASHLHLRVCSKSIEMWRNEMYLKKWNEMYFISLRIFFLWERERKLNPGLDIASLMHVSSVPSLCNAAWARRAPCTLWLISPSSTGEHDQDFQTSDCRDFFRFQILLQYISHHIDLQNLDGHENLTT